MSTDQRIHVRFTSPGFHRWADAETITGERRGYLATRHRHLFHYEVSTEVTHDDREIEFHDLLDECRSFVNARTEHEGRSCEMLAAELLDFIDTTFGTGDRERSVTVWEDNECGASVSRRPQ